MIAPDPGAPAGGLVGDGRDDRRSRPGILLLMMLEFLPARSELEPRRDRLAAHAAGRRGLQCVACGTRSARCSRACSCTTAHRVLHAALLRDRGAWRCCCRGTTSSAPASITTEYYALLLAATLGMIVMAASNDLITIFLGLELDVARALRAGGIPAATSLESNEAAHQVLPARRVRQRRSCSTASRCSTARPAPPTSARWRRSSPARRCSANPLLARSAACCCWSASASRWRRCPSTCGRPDAYEGAPDHRDRLHVGWAPRPQASPRCCGWCCVALARSPGRLEADPHLDRHPHHDRGQRHRAAPEQPQAHARLLEHRARRLRAGRAGGGRARRRSRPRSSTSTVYSLMNLGAFGILALLGRGADERRADRRPGGLGFRHPVLGFAMAVFMLSLGGIPPTAGFMGKVYVFSVAVKANLIPLVDGRRAEQRGVGLLLPARDGRDVHAGARRASPCRSSWTVPARARRGRSRWRSHCGGGSRAQAAAGAGAAQRPGRCLAITALSPSELASVRAGRRGASESPIASASKWAMSVFCGVRGSPRCLTVA